MLDPRPREEMNQMVMDAMTHTSKRYWMVTGIVGTGGGGLSVWDVGLHDRSSPAWGLPGIRRPVYWGIFISTFVFWIGISHAGTFVSAILRVFKAEYRRPFTRAAELMTTFGLAAGAMYPLIHLGRVWVFYWMIPISQPALAVA